MLIYFPGESARFTKAGYFYGEELKKLAEEQAVFVRVGYEADRTPAPYADESPVPVKKLAGDNPSRDYNVKSYPTFIVTDWHGNEYFRMTKKPSAKSLEKQFAKVADKIEETNKKLRKSVDKAKAAWVKKDARKTLKALLKSFKQDVVGLEAAEASITLYHEVLDEARGVVAELEESGDTKKLKALAKLYRKTELEAEIKEILEGE